MDINTIQRWFRLTVGPILLIFFTPIVAFAVCTANLQTGGSLSDLYQQVGGSSSSNVSAFITFLKLIRLNQGMGSATGWMILTLFVAVQLVVLRCVPGDEKEGVAASGRVPVYRMNGLAAFLLTTLGYIFLSFGLDAFPATVLYDNLQELMWVTMIVSFLLCVWLAVRGRSKTGTETSTKSRNSLLIDFFWGREVHPNVMGFELKQVTNCRFGMMMWPLIVISCVAKQWEHYGYVSNSMATAAFLQLVYIAKFFHWESGYMRTLDMMHDRAGYYICWGCMIWVPCIYSSQVVYLVLHPVSLHPLITAALLIFGLLCIGLNYHADWQKQEVRKSDGRCLIWGKPPKMIRAKYTDENNVETSQILLMSGWWGISRHFHYIPELGAALCWTLPCQFQNWLPYFYLVYLTLLLVDRTNRDDRRCFNKYKSYWTQYIKTVPYKMVPYIY
ncbi:uncharacterized protein LOC134195659 [Corticium candelabrum]|uniref:uncharacterized protein LOC134195659 n=1 Tax=Corticium candelabrum TaxID=121492 RepID=UPI002E2551C4|nr:uncharacterized protein LOC134195659 [Corticium candelabrum]